jgi:hypothetical protein
LITAKKYPEYKEYQRLVGKFLPNVLSTSSAGEEAPKVAGKKNQ